MDFLPVSSEPMTITAVVTIVILLISGVYIFRDLQVFGKEKRA